jgi:hypothetical protein
MKHLCLNKREVGLLTIPPKTRISIMQNSIYNTVIIFILLFILLLIINILEVCFNIWVDLASDNLLNISIRGG